jgi:glyoxylase-like metal-dependent hydrolase (beta-lactamase superfamily II)
VRRRESGTFEAAFPRARIIVQRGEIEVARDSRNERLRAAYRHIGDCLDPVDARLEVIEGDAEIVPGVSAIVSGGHTADHQVAVVRSHGETFVHLADIVPTRSHMRGPWNQAYDLDALRTMEQKADYLKRAVEQRWWLSFAHDERIFAAQVTNDRGRLVLETTVEVPPGLDGR